LPKISEGGEILKVRREEPLVKGEKGCSYLREGQKSREEKISYRQETRTEKEEGRTVESIISLRLSSLKKKEKRRNS